MAASPLHGTILLVGAGKMGGALLSGWLARGLAPSKVAVIDPSPPLPDTLRLIADKKIARDPDPKSFSPDAIVLAVKPQAAGEIVPKIAAFAKPKTIVVSVMAGRTIASLEAALPNAAIVRSIPNTPASVGCAITVAVANKRVNTAEKSLVNDLLAAVGTVEWVDDERLIDAVTAVSGSGPAYVFYLADCMAKAGIAAGLPPELAIKLARETVSGAGELMRQSKLDASTLRENVTSPGGTTAAALEILMGKDGLEALLTRAIAAATKRSRDLAG